MEAQELGTLLRRLRAGHRLSVEQLAGEAQVRASTVYRWERGDCRPRLPELVAVLDALQATEAERQTVIAALDAPRALPVLRGSDSPAHVPAAGDLWGALRRRQDLDQREVARRMGVHPSTVTRWERTETSVPRERVDALCDLLLALPEEREFLRRHAALLPSGPPRTPDEWEQAVTGLVLMKERGETFPGDLTFLSMEARLWPLASQADYRRVLHDVCHWHADWLYARARYREAAITAERAYGLLPERGGTYASVRSLMFITHCLFTDEEPGRAGQALHRLGTLEGAYPAPEIGCELARDMAHFAGLAGDARSVFRLLNASDAHAQHIGDVALARSEGRVSRNCRAASLIRAGRASEAEHFLPTCPDPRPYNQAAHELLWVRWLMAAGQKAGAHARLGSTLDFLGRHDLPMFSRQADALALLL